MATAAGKWREDQVLIICPGSHTTMAQLGCNELNPPQQQHKFRTRMFWDPEARGYRPVKTHKRKKEQKEQKTEYPTTHAGTDAGTDASTEAGNEEGFEWVEDPDSDEGAIYPLVAGHIVNMPAFLAFIDHVHGLLASAHHNTPIMLMASPQWTRDCCEKIARYVFEKTRAPALCLINSAVATYFGIKWPNLTVVDIGYEKVDVTCVCDGAVASQKSAGWQNFQWQAPERWISGGERFTERLLELLGSRGFTHDMAEELKKSAICEVLPFSPDAPAGMDLPTITSPDPQAASSLGQSPGTGAAMGGDDEEAPDGRIDDGVLDVAGIVASGQTQEFLAKNKGKAGRRGREKEPEGGTRAPKLTNSQRTTNVFHYEKIVDVDDEDATAAPAPAPVVAEAAVTEAADQVAAGAGTGKPMKRVRRDIEVGLERFTFVDRRDIDRITDTIYMTVQGIPSMPMRAACWENLVFVGNGSRLRGLRDNILQTLTARHLIYPSTATIFTSELPSNAATPSGTGSQTPTSSFTGAPHQLPQTSSGVNPLLQAATTASAAAAGNPSGTLLPGSAVSAMDASSAHSPGFRSQTPTAIKLAPLPSYLGEWSKHGFEDAMFLGCLVASRLAFCQSVADSDAQRQMSLSRQEYNEQGPKGIRLNSMLG